MSRQSKLELPSGKDLALILQILQPELEKLAFLEAQNTRTQKLIEELRLIAQREAGSQAMDEVLGKVTELENSQEAFAGELKRIQSSVLTKPEEVMGLYDLNSRVRGLEHDIARQDARMEEIKGYLEGKIDALMTRKGLTLAWWQVAVGVIAIVASFVLGYIGHLLGWP